MQQGGDLFVYVCLTIYEDLITRKLAGRNETEKTDRLQRGVTKPALLCVSWQLYHERIFSTSSGQSIAMGTHAPPRGPTPRHRDSAQRQGFITSRIVFPVSHHTVRR